MNFVKLFSQHRQTSAALIGIWLIAFRKGRSAAASLLFKYKNKKKHFRLTQSEKLLSAVSIQNHHFIQNFITGRITAHARLYFALKRLVWDWMSSPRSRLSGGHVAATRRQTADTRSALMTDAAAAAAAAAGIDQTATSCSCAPWWILVVSSLRSKKCFPCLISSDKY